jgi:DNA-directed RNA polymerase subunit H (RpoH/RPB5)
LGGLLAEKVLENQVEVRHYLIPEHVLIKKEKVDELMAELS